MSDITTTVAFHGLDSTSSVSDTDLLGIEDSENLKNITVKNVKDYVIGSDTLETTSQTVNGAINEVNSITVKTDDLVQDTSINTSTLAPSSTVTYDLQKQINSIKSDFLGIRFFNVAFGEYVNNTYLNSTSVYIPFKASEVNITLNNINIPGTGDIALDYKNISLSDYEFHISCTTTGANGCTELANQVAVIQVTIASV